MAKISVMGTGSWGTALAILLHNNGHQVMLWSAHPEKAASLNETREDPKKLPGIKIPEEIAITGDEKKALDSPDIVVFASPSAYMRAISAAARSTAGILVQFPFYAGIQLMMEHSGLGGLITEFFINVANKDTFPVMTFFSSALINFAVPSGGGHWVIQGPFVMPAAQALGADLGKSVMAIAYGEQWMNMAQPFWALPALAIAGLGVRDIMGYCITALLFSGVIFVIGLTLF